MPTIPIDDEVMDQISGELDALGVPSDLSPARVQASDSAGFTIVPAEGGEPVQSLTTLVATMSGVQGKPGWYVHEITLADASKIRIVQIPGGKGQPPQYIRG